MKLRKFKPGAVALLLIAAAAILVARVGSMISDEDFDLAERMAAIETAAGDKGDPEAAEAGDKDEAAASDDEARSNPTAPVTAGDVATIHEPKAMSDERRAVPRRSTGGIPRDPSLFSDAEIEVLQQLARRRAALEQREQEMEMREGLLTAAEQRVESKISELKKLRKIVAELIKQHEAAEKDKIDALVKIYEKMKPKDAARIFNKLEISILLSVMKGMKEAKVAPILAAMDAKKAREVTAELAVRRTELPEMEAETGS